jgi:hypothetical protein
MSDAISSVLMFLAMVVAIAAFALWAPEIAGRLGPRGPRPTTPISRSALDRARGRRGLRR